MCTIYKESESKYEIDVSEFNLSDVFINSAGSGMSNAQIIHFIRFFSTFLQGGNISPF